MQNSYKNFVVFATTVITVFLNVLVNLIPLNAITTAEVSDKYFTYFTPAGLTFAIWGVIYLGLLAYAVYHLRNPREVDSWLGKAFWWYLLASAANILWLVSWHYEQLGLSVLCIAVLLVSLIMIYLKLEVSVYKASAKTRWMVHIPISIYLGWVSVATIAAISAALTQVSWTGFGVGPEVWSGIMIGVATALALKVLYFLTDYAFVLVVVWAVLGIGANFYTSAPLVLGAVIVSLFSLTSGLALKVYEHFLKPEFAKAI
ncbi:MAG: tryptophan-rich sensory protein [Candidatus Doudnabacteria bacterium]|nr:tryptophan-rich sensory protein [Candidatus Doudnabacteria bacterium]